MINIIFNYIFRPNFQRPFSKYFFIEIKCKKLDKTYEIIKITMDDICKLKKNNKTLITNV